MHRLVFALSVALCASGVAQAQPPEFSVQLNTHVVPQGGTVDVTITGPPLYYAVIGSQTNSGFSYGGLDLGVGPDVTVLDTGRIVSGPVTVTVPARVAQRDRYYIQVVLSPNPAYTVLTVQSRSHPVVNEQVAALMMPLAGRVGPAGAVLAASPGVTVTRTAVGTYRIDHTAVYSVLDMVPAVTPIGAGVDILGLTSTDGVTTVTLSTDAPFWFSIHPAIN